MMEYLFEKVKHDITTKFWDGDLDHPFIVAGDTDSFFIEMKELKQKHTSKDNNEFLETVVETGNKYLDIINNELLRSYLPKQLNWDPKYVQLQIEYEACGKTYNLPAKKKYAFYMQHPKEKLDIKGLEIQRSDYPARTREKLKDLLYMVIVEEKSLEEIKSFIKEVQKEFEHDIMKWDLSLARPVSWSNTLSNYKKVPIHVLSMLLWNYIVNDEVFQYGSKGYAFRVSTKINRLPDHILEFWQNLTEKFGSKTKTIKWLVVPENTTLEDIEKYVPDAIQIDVKDMISFSWLDRVKLLMEGFDNFTLEDEKSDNNDDTTIPLWDL